MVTSRPSAPAASHRPDDHDHDPEGTAMLSRRHHRWGLLRALALVGLFLAVVVALPRAVAPTSAAWSDDVRVRATVTAGTWAVPGAGTCTVRNANGTVDASKPCTVTSVSASFWGSGAGRGAGNALAELSAPGIGNTQYVAFDVTLPSTGAPAWWSWSRTTVTTVNNGATITSACSAMPRVTGRLAANLGATPNLFQTFSDERGAAALCS